MYFFHDIIEAAKSSCVQAAVKVKEESQGKGESGSQKGRDDKSFQHDVPWPCSCKGEQRADMIQSVKGLYRQNIWSYIRVWFQH